MQVKNIYISLIDAHLRHQLTKNNLSIKLIWQ